MLTEVRPLEGAHVGGAGGFVGGNSSELVALRADAAIGVVHAPQALHHRAFFCAAHLVWVAESLVPVLLMTGVVFICFEKSVFCFAITCCWFAGLFLLTNLAGKVACFKGAVWNGFTAV